MKLLVLMVGMAAPEGQYEYYPLLLADRTTCLLLVESITRDRDFYQHAYCTEQSYAPFRSPRPAARP